ncbi:MAG: lipopolysaccharide biosynthesis protein [Cyanobacteria bacterium J06634_5]
MFKSGLYNFVGAGFRLCVVVGTIPVLIQLIGLPEYGLWTIVSTVIAIVSLAEAGLSVSTTFFLSRDLATEDVVSISETLTVSFGAIALLATGASSLLWFNADLVIFLFPKLSAAQHQVAVHAFQLGALVIWLKLLQRIFVGIEQAYKRYDLFNVINTLQVGLVNLGMVGVASRGGLTLALMQWQIISNMVILTIHIVATCYLFRHIRLQFLWSTRRYFEIFRYSVMTWMSSMGSALFTQGDKLIIGSILGPTTLGIYAAITNITTQINIFSSLPVQPLLPHLSEQLQHLQRQPAEILKLVRQAFGINVAVAIGLGGSLVSLAPMLLRLLLPGVETAEFLGVFYVATIIYTLYSINAVGYYILFSTENVALCLKIQLGSGLLSLLFIALGSQSLGLWGAVMGNAGYLLTGLLTYTGMSKLSISAGQWLKWLSFMGVWFAAISAIACLLPPLPMFRIVLLVMHVSVLVSWFLLMYKNDLKFAN